MLLSMLPFPSVTFAFNQPLHTEAVAHPQVPFRPRYLFVDPPDETLVAWIGIGADRAALVGAGELPAKLFAVSGMAQAMADVQTLVDELARKSYEGEQPTFDVVIKVDIPVDEHKLWPMPLLMPVCYPGMVVRVGLVSERNEHRILSRRVRVAMAGESLAELRSPWSRST